MKKTVLNQPRQPILTVKQSVDIATAATDTILRPIVENGGGTADALGLLTQVVAGTLMMCFKLDGFPNANPHDILLAVAKEAEKIILHTRASNPSDELRKKQ